MATVKKKAVKKKTQLYPTFSAVDRKKWETKHGMKFNKTNQRKVSGGK